MEIYDRLRMIREANGSSQARFAAKFGIAQSTYGQWEIGKRAIPDEFKVQLSNIGVNLHWLLTGEGQMIKNTMEGTKLQLDPSNSYRTPSGQVYPYPDQRDATYSVPILASKVSAGPGCEWSRADFRELRMPTLEKFFLGYPKDDIFAAEVVGDSMQDIDLIDGDFVFACHNLVRGNGIYVMALDTEVIVKRLEIDTVERKLRIISKNSDYPDKVVDPDRVIILGKVIGWLHRYAN